MTLDQNIKKKKLTKFDKTVVAEVKREAELSSDGKHPFDVEQEGVKEYNVKNCTYVKLWMSDIELRYSGLIVFSGEVSSVKSQKSPEDEGQDEFVMNKIIEENRLLDKLNLLRRSETESADVEESSSFDEVTKKKILASGFQIAPLKPSDPQKKPEGEARSSSDLAPPELEEEESIALIAPSQQIAALEILTGNKLVHTIELSVEVDEATAVESKEFVESSIGLEYEEKSFLECIEIKKNLIQKIGKLKLENANLSLYVQKLRNKEIKTKEYRNILEVIERNKEDIRNQNIELLKIEGRIQRLSAEDKMEARVENAKEAALNTSQEKTVLRKKERRKVIISAILDEAKRRKKTQEESKMAEQAAVDAAATEQENTASTKQETTAVTEQAAASVATKQEVIADTEKKTSAATEQETTTATKKGEGTAVTEKETPVAKPKAEIKKKPDKTKEETSEDEEEIRVIAKMVVWLQENDNKMNASIETRKERGATAVKNLRKLLASDRKNYEKIIGKIKQRFETKVYEKNATRTSIS